MKNIPINKGNYISFETKNRERLFEKNKAIGWESEYKQYRDNWSQFPKEQFVNDYPLLVDIELSALCNLSCPMCYTITDNFKEKVSARSMDFEMFKKIIVANNTNRFADAIDWFQKIFEKENLKRAFPPCKADTKLPKN